MKAVSKILHFIFRETKEAVKLLSIWPILSVCSAQALDNSTTTASQLDVLKKQRDPISSRIAVLDDTAEASRQLCVVVVAEKGMSFATSHSAQVNSSLKTPEVWMACSRFPY